MFLVIADEAVRTSTCVHLNTCAPQHVFLVVADEAVRTSTLV